MIYSLIIKTIALPTHPHALWVVVIQNETAISVYHFQIP